MQRSPQRDKKFLYSNQGFSVWASYFRAVKDILIHQRVTEVRLSPQQLGRKMHYLLRTGTTLENERIDLWRFRVDKRYSKDQVLEMYLNNVPFGGTAVGAEAAANLYFDKPAKDLIRSKRHACWSPQSPNATSNSKSERHMLERTKEVLGRMETGRDILHRIKVDCAPKVR